MKTPIADLHHKPYNYVFNYTDHLGNVRVSYGIDADNTIKIMEENNYYPFGLRHRNYNMTKLDYDENGMFVDVPVTAVSVYKYKYNGKEWQDELGLNMYDYGARNYDAAIVRWGNIDPLAEKYFCFSPYNYVTNNPIAKYDPDGMDMYFVNEQGKFTLALKEEGKDRLYASTTDELGITKIKAWDSSKDDEGTTFGGIELQNGILSQLTGFKVDKNGYGFYSSIVNQNTSPENDMLKLFHFVSNNTEVEFSMNFYKDKNNQNKIVLGTYQTETYSPGSDTYGIYDNSQIIKKYHNHPPNQVTSSERYHMGGDAHNAVNGKTSFPSYVFYPKTTNLYNVTQYSIDFIQKINHDYKKLK